MTSNGINDKEAILSYWDYDVNGQETHSIQIEYVGQSRYVYPRTTPKAVVNDVNRNIEKFLKHCPDYDILMDADKSMERFFEEYNYKWNEETKRIEKI